MGSESTPITTIESSITPPEDETDTHEDVNIDRDVIADANKLAKVIHQSADLLLERLLSHLSQFPEYPVNAEDDEDLQLEQGEKSDDNDRLGESDIKEEETMMLQRGLTIPVSAIAWLSDQLDALDVLQNQTGQAPELELASETEDADCQQPKSNNTQSCDLEPWLGTEAAKSLRYRLNLLRFLLPRAQLIRLTRKSWPPRSNDDVPSYLCASSPKQKLKQWWNKRRRQPSDTPNDITTEAKANEFLRYTARFQNGASNCVNLWKVFPNATILILESVPPAWINLNGRANEQQLLATPRSYNEKLALRLISVTNAAIYDLKNFLPPPTRSPSTAVLRSPMSQSLTHLKLDHCSLGELTTGFSSRLGQLVHLEYLSLRHNQFRSAKTLLKGLRPLTRLKYLDVSSNQLVGCFGPYANLCLGGQVKILKLSNNLLETCNNSGLEKCYGLVELWLDGNNIQDVVEVSCLARLPDLQCLALQKNPFSNKLGNNLPVSSFPDEREITDYHANNHYENPFYDPNWKIKLWTWFQHERRALTPLELPLLNKKTKHFGANPTQVSMMGRMTRDEWDRIQEESFSVATTVATTLSTTSSIAPSTEESQTLLEPVRNRKVTKTSKTRQAKIHTFDTENNGNGAVSFKVAKSQRARKRRQKKHKKADIVLENFNDRSINENEAKPRASRKKQKDSCELDVQQLSFSLQDVLISIQDEHLQQYPQDKAESDEPERSSDEKDKKTEQDETEVGSQQLKEEPIECTAENNLPNNPFLDDNVSLDESIEKTNDSKEGEEETTSIAQESIEESVKEIPKKEGEIEEISGKGESNDGEVLKEKEKCNENEPEQSQNVPEASKKQKTISSPRSSPKRAPRKTPKRSPKKSPRRPEPIDEDRIFVRPKVSSIKLGRMGNYKPFDALSSDWDDVIKKASEGRIPDGLLKSPVEESPDDFGIADDLFSDDAADLLGEAGPKVSTTAKSTGQASASGSTSDPTQDPTVSSDNRLGNALPEHVWEDDGSVLSSLGASRDDIIPRANKFRLAEENSSYDGPDSSRGLKVVENLQLYFESFVFPTSMPDIPADVLEEMEEDQDDWQLITMYFPRIQLWPDDRRLLELERVRISSSMTSTADWTTNRERFLRVWEEDIVPCGKPAMKRLPPNRRNRLGFHGDKLFLQNADVDAYSECRKVLLCLSSKAFYVIPENDDVTKSHKQQSKTRRFPLPLNRGDRFRDAPWPHAVARHSLGDLEAICIGFEFQRLTLRFRNLSLPKSDPFVYVLLTGDKRSSVRIFQEIQKLAKDFGDNHAVSNLGKKPSAIEIENDSQIVLDSLHSVFDSTIASASQGQEAFGTMMHFQIVQQQWKHGDRGTVRRVCVITDTKILLLDEDYAADGHDISSVTVKGKNMADARYRLVDHAELSLVSQVQAANADPRAITIIINPSALSRTKRWRLICRDREGAERLVEDARKALEDM